MSAIDWPIVEGMRVKHADGDTRDVVGAFEHDGHYRIVTAHRFGGPGTRWVYETFGRSAFETGLLKLVKS